MSKFDWNKPSKIITVHGKDVDAEIIAGCFRYTMSRLNMTCKGVSRWTKLPLNVVISVVNNHNDPSKEDIESVARFLFKDELEKKNMNNVSKVSTEELTYTVISKIIEDNDQ